MPESTQSSQQEQGQLPGDVSPYEGFNEDDAEKRNIIAAKFYTLSESINASLDKSRRLISKTEVIKFQLYISMSDKEEQELIDEINKLNQSIGASRSILDSYITFTRSQPDFDKFLNIIFQVHDFMESYAEKSIFYRFNLRTSNKRLYPLKLNKALHKLSLLFSRLRGTLGIAGDYIIDLPPASRPSPGIDGGNPYWRGDYGSYGGYEDWRRPFIDRDLENIKPRRKTRDIGDIDDKL